MGREKELGSIYNIGVILCITVFLITEVVWFWSRGWVCAFGLFPLFFLFFFFIEREIGGRVGRLLGVFHLGIVLPRCLFHI